MILNDLQLRILGLPKTNIFTAEALLHLARTVVNGLESNLELNTYFKKTIEADKVNIFYLEELLKQEVNK